MSDLHDKIVAQRGKLSNIVAKIPGFKGYIEKESRRSADRMLRDHLAGSLDNLILRYDTIVADILDLEGGLSMMSNARQSRDKIKAYRDRISTAAPKYAGLFADVKVDEAALDRIYAFDEAQIIYVDKLKAVVDRLASAVDANEGIKALIDETYDLALEANEAFKLRDDEIMDISSTL
ncbi:hypothetical protein MASR2M15_14540 [Anaerolineales bacterium]